MARASRARATCSTWRWSTTSWRRAAPGSATGASASGRGARTRATSSRRTRTRFSSSSTGGGGGAGRAGREARPGESGQVAAGPPPGALLQSLENAGCSIESLRHQGRQAELPVGSTDWLLAVVGAVAVRVTKGPPNRLALHERRDRLEVMLRASGLAYGTGAVDPAVELPPDAVPGARAFAHFVAGLVRLCAKAAALSAAPYFVEDGPEVTPDVAVDTRRNQLLAVLGAVAGRTKESARLFANPLGASEASLQRLAARIATRLSRRYLALGGPFAGLPLHNGLCAIEVRTCASVALAAFAHGRISPAATGITDRAALAWRCVLVELLSGLAASQENGRE